MDSLPSGAMEPAERGAGPIRRRGGRWRRVIWGAAGAVVIAALWVVLGSVLVKPPGNVYKLTVSGRENAISQTGTADSETAQGEGWRPRMSSITLPAGRYKVTLESDLNLCLGRDDARVEQVLLVVWGTPDPNGRYAVVTEGTPETIAVPAKRGPVLAFVVDGANLDNRGEATVTFEPR